MLMRRRIRLFYVLVAAFVITAGGLMALNRLDQDISALRDTARETRLRQLAVETQKSDMQRELAIKDTDAYIREMARIQKSYLMPGEIRFVVTNPQALYGTDEVPEAEVAETEAAEEKQKPLWLEIVLLVIGAAAIAVGARLLVDNGTLIAQALGVPDSVIGLTMVALGTSLPDLITAITSLAKGHGALSLGNVIGANLFNIILVSGAAITISPFAVPAEKTIAGLNSSLVIDLPLMLGVMGILCIPTLLKGRLQRWQGILLLAIYAAFTIYQFVS